MEKNQTNKSTDLYVMICDTCHWKERTIGTPYKVCPECGHAVGAIKVRGGK
jgi:rRNA maturation endonuclease Nob1